MAETPKRRLKQLNIDRIAASGTYARIFADKFTGLQSLAERQAYLQQTIATGSMIEDMGLTSAFRALDNEYFAKRADRVEVLENSIRLFRAGEPQNTPSEPPAGLAEKAITLDDIERELLSDDGLLANANQAVRIALLEKVFAKYATSEVKEAVAETTSVEPPAPKVETKPAAPAVVIDGEGGQNSTMKLPVKKTRVATFK